MHVNTLLFLYGIYLVFEFPLKVLRTTMTMTVSAVMIINATATTTTPAMIPAVLSDSAHVEATLSVSYAAVEKRQHKNAVRERESIHTLTS